MELDTEVKTVHRVQVSDLLLITEAAQKADGLFPPQSMMFDASPVFTEQDFLDEGWHTELLREVTSHVAGYGEELKGVWYYLGWWDVDINKRMGLIHMADLETYSDRVTFNGWRVRVTCEEVEWGVG
jgi:hypothetical protein